MIRFFCENCGHQMWELAEWDVIKHLTLEQVKGLLVCSDCLLAEIRREKEITGKYTASKLARALVEQHSFTWDVAYCEAYFYIHGRMTTTPWAVALSHMESVKNVPIVTPVEAEFIHQNYLKRR